MDGTLDTVWLGLDCSMAHDMDPRLGLPMASATEALTAHHVEPPIRSFAWIAAWIAQRIIAWIGKPLGTTDGHCLEQWMDPQLFFLMGSRIAGTTALLMVSQMEQWTARLTQFGLDWIVRWLMTWIPGWAFQWPQQRKL